MIALYIHTGGAGGLIGTLLVAALLVWLIFYVLPLPDVVRTIFAVIIALALVLMLLPGCGTLSDYNSHVAARQDSLSGYTKDGDFGGAVSHRVEYR